MTIFATINQIKTNYSWSYSILFILFNNIPVPSATQVRGDSAIKIGTFNSCSKTFNKPFKSEPPPFQADKEHLHHQLLGMNFSQRTTVLIIYGIDILFAAASILYTLKDPILGKIIYIVILILVLWFVFHTTIISDKSPQLTKKIESKLGLTSKAKNKTNKKSTK